MSLRQVKDDVRSAALARRAAVDPARRTAAAASFARDGLAAALRLAPRPAPLVSAFLPIRDEPDTRPLLAALARAGIATALPATPPRGQPLRFRGWRDGDALVPGRFGTAEPLAQAPDAAPDLLFVPLAAFDRRGFRLGYGAGYYDGALLRLRQKQPVVAIGLAYAVQEVACVPTEPHDQRLDAVLTDEGLMTFGSP